MTQCGTVTRPRGRALGPAGSRGPSRSPRQQGQGTEHCRLQELLLCLGANARGLLPLQPHCHSGSGLAGPAVGLQYIFMFYNSKMGCKDCLFFFCLFVSYLKDTDKSL